MSEPVVGATADQTLPGIANPTGTVADLDALRAKKVHLAQAATNLLAYEDTYEIGKEVRDLTLTLAASHLDVLVTCILCGKPHPVTVLIGGESTPRVVVCDPCDAVLNAAAEAVSGVEGTES